MGRPLTRHDELARTISRFPPYDSTISSLTVRALPGARLRRQALRLWRTAARLRGLTAPRAAGRSTLPSVTAAPNPIRRLSRTGLPSIPYNEAGRSFARATAYKGRRTTPTEARTSGTNTRHGTAAGLCTRTIPSILGTLSSGESVPLLQADRRRHVYIVGQTGTGKTGLLTNLMHADLDGGAGFCFLDPHGDASQEIASATPPARTKDVIYLDPSDPTHTFAYNPLSGVRRGRARDRDGEHRLGVQKHLEPELGAAPRIYSHQLAAALARHQGSELARPPPPARRRSLSRMAAPPLRRSGDPDLLANGICRLRHSLPHRGDRADPKQDRHSALEPVLRSILCQNSSTLDISRMMNQGKVLIVNLSKGNLGTEPAHLLGALLITAFSQAAEARRHMPEDERRDFTLYVDEFQNFATESFASILSEARKWRLSLVAANQHVSQLPETLQHAVFGNAGTLIAFRVGAKDAALLADELGLESARALTATNNFHAWLRLMDNGTPREPRMIRMLPPRPPGTKLDRVIALARARHMIPRSLVEARISAFFPAAPGKRSRHRKKRNPDA